VKKRRDEIRHAVGLDDGAIIGREDVAVIEVAAALVLAEARLCCHGWGEDQGKVAAVAAAAIVGVNEATIGLIIEDGGATSKARCNGG
jgi:hypothetical protein